MKERENSFTQLLVWAFHFDRGLNPGRNIGVCLRYSMYSSPRRFISSGSSICFSSHTLINTKSGVKIHTSDTELIPNPTPNKKQEDTSEHRIPRIPIGTGLDYFRWRVEGHRSSLHFYKMKCRPSNSSNTCRQEKNCERQPSCFRQKVG